MELSDEQLQALERDPHWRQALETLREQYVVRGSPRGPVCHNRVCMFVARRRVFWPVQPGEDYPLYCDRCAAWARRILETLGMRYADEALPPLPGEEPVRAFALEVPHGR